MLQGAVSVWAERFNEQGNVIDVTIIQGQHITFNCGTNKAILTHPGLLIKLMTSSIVQDQWRLGTVRPRELHRHAGVSDAAAVKPNALRRGECVIDAKSVFVAPKLNDFLPLEEFCELFGGFVIAEVGKCRKVLMMRE